MSDRVDMRRYLNREDPLESSRKHADGSSCFAGIQRCPEVGEPCCDAFETHTDVCTYDIRYEWWAKAGFWVIKIASSAGGGGVKISFCPHCGSSLWTPP